MSPTHAMKGQKRYRYYISQNDGEAASSEPCWRISATDIETLVCARIFSAIESATGERVSQGDLSGDAIDRLATSANALTDELKQAIPAKTRAALLNLVHRIDLTEQALSFELNLARLDPAMKETIPTTTMIPIGFVRSGRRVRLLIPPAIGEQVRPRNPALLKLVAQAFTARREMEAGGSFDEVASRLGYGREYLADMIRTSYLAPSIITAIIEGTQPMTLSRKQLVQTNRIPLDWAEQRQMFGFG